MHILKQLGNEALRKDEITAIELFVSILREWSATHNLISLSNFEREVSKQVYDSIALGLLLANKSDLNIIDVGSGNGFPAIIAAILNPAKSFTLFEPRSKRVSFLQFAIARIRLKNANVSRETFDHKTEAKLNFRYTLTSKAVFSKEKYLELLLRLKRADSAIGFISTEAEGELCHLQRIGKTDLFLYEIVF